MILASVGILGLGMLFGFLLGLTFSGNPETDPQDAEINQPSKATGE